MAAWRSDIYLFVLKNRPSYVVYHTRVAPAKDKHGGLALPSCPDKWMDGWMDGWMDVKEYFTRSLRSLVKDFSTLEDKCRISARPCNILHITEFATDKYI